MTKSPQTTWWIPSDATFYLGFLFGTPAALIALTNYLHWKWMGEPIWHSSHPLAILSLLVILASMLHAALLGLWVRRVLVLRFGTEKECADVTRWDEENCRDEEDWGDEVE